MVCSATESVGRVIVKGVFVNEDVQNITKFINHFSQPRLYESFWLNRIPNVPNVPLTWDNLVTHEGWAQIDDLKNHLSKSIKTAMKIRDLYYEEHTRHYIREMSSIGLRPTITPTNTPSSILRNGL